MGIIYLATNKINGKRYIGATRVALRRRMSEHKCHSRKHKKPNYGHFYRAIRKFGFDAFEFKVIVKCDDAEMAEMEAAKIAELKPEYNSTSGGDGAAGRRATARMRQRASETHKGNKHRLGMSHREDTKELLRAHGLARKELFQQYSALGPAASSRRVKCLDDGLEYPSASAAARAYGAAKSAIIELCLGRPYRKTVNGRRFAYCDG